MITYDGNVATKNNKWIRCTMPTEGVRIGNLIWSRFYVTPDMCGIQSNASRKIHDELIHYYRYETIQNATFKYGWRLPTINDFDALRNAVGSGQGQKVVSTLDGGTDDYGLGLYRAGIWDGNGSQTFTNDSTAAFLTNSKKLYNTVDSQGRFYSMFLTSDDANVATPFRLVKEVYA